MIVSFRLHIGRRKGILLEITMGDRLDFRLEVAELQRSPTASLEQIRRKWEGQQVLSRSEWIFLAHNV